MLEKLNEPVKVSVKFDFDRVFPVAFEWRQKTYTVEKVHLIHSERQGNDVIHYFSVTDSVNFFRLAFFTRDLSWRIEELYYDG